MKKGYGEASPAMRSRLAVARGPHRFLLLALCLLLAVAGLNYWRLFTANSELTERLRRLEGLLERNNAERQTLDDARHKCQGELLKKATELHRLQADMEERVLKMQQQADLLADMQEDANNCQKEAEELKEKHEQELKEAAAGRHSRLTEAEQRLEDVQKQLRETSRNLTICSSQSCGDRVKQLQFDLDTCRFSRQHAGTPGIVRPTGGGDAAGPGQLPLLSPAAVSVQQTALRAAGKAAARSSPGRLSAGGHGAELHHLDNQDGHHLDNSPPASGQENAANAPVSQQRDAGPAPIAPSAGQLRPPPGGGEEAAAAAAPAGGEEAVDPAESPAAGEVLSAGGLLRPAAAASGLEVAPVDTGLEEEEDGGKVEDVEAEEAALEDPAADDAAAGQAKVAPDEEEVEGDGDDGGRPAGRVIPKLAGDADEEEGDAAGQPPADLQYPGGQVKEDPEGAADDPAADDTAPLGADQSGTAVKDAALINGLQELSEKADPADPAAGPDQQLDADQAAEEGDTLAEPKPAEPVAAGQKMADFEDIGAA